MTQTTSNIFMVRPANFGYNSETAVSNVFQHNMENTDNVISKKVLKEFNNYVNLLVDNGIDVTVINDSSEPIKPDAIFPNNWISLHENGTIITYPMFAKNRQAEVRPEIINKIKQKFKVLNHIDLTRHCSENIFLEGTGSIIFDHVNKKAYACLSPRTDKNLFEKVCHILDYKPVSFTSSDENNTPIYHTNVMMCIDDDLAVICLESLKNQQEREFVKKELINDGHEIVDITLNQVKKFAGNMLALKSKNDEKILVMSSTALNCLTEKQKLIIESKTKIVSPDISTIEKIGGGSARCMIAEIFLKKK